MTFLHPAAADVFVRVVRGLAHYEPRGHESAWVFQIARHVLVDHRRKPPRNGVSLEEREARAAAAPATQLVAFGLREALERLPDAERLAFLLREVAGLSYGEIAAVCEPPRTA
jgi:RNA polymerase sigma-70 factor (ECF subfamily)